VTLNVFGFVFNFWFFSTGLVPSTTAISSLVPGTGVSGENLRLTVAGGVANELIYFTTRRDCSGASDNSYALSSSLTLTVFGGDLIPGIYFFLIF
jgi:hypothetical protein